MNIPRNEYPRPQLVRESFICLNGEWDFKKDFSKSELDKKLFTKRINDEKIIVPFAPESDLSGIGYKDFMPCVWYGKEINIPDTWQNKRVILHFGAVDYHAKVWINSKYAGEHKGGYTPFSFDITDYLEEENYICLCAVDDTRGENQPIGKQSDKYQSQGCSYTRTTGIWQTVWMEAVEENYITDIKTTPNFFDQSVTFELTASNQIKQSAEIEVLFDGKTVGKDKVNFSGNYAVCSIKLDESHPWTAGKGNLYDVKINLVADDKTSDIVTSYFGLRSITWDKKGIMINGEYVYQRLVLDQGFYPVGIYTAPDDQALKNDIEISMDMGFNGARLHEKIFEPRFLYWADKLGYLCWGEHANWGLRITEFDSIRHFLPEWEEAVNRDYSHPSIVGWCPFNETWDRVDDNVKGYREQQCNDVLEYVYKATKSMDKTRPVIDTSGNFHVVTDIYDIHYYEQDVEKFKEVFQPNREGKVHITFKERQEHAYNNQPFFVSEFGGIGWFVDQKVWGIYEKSWGYGNGPKTEEEFIDRYTGLVKELLDNKGVCAFCYTQLYDVEQEQNGLYTYDRKPKFDPKIIYDINTTKASIEK